MRRQMIVLAAVAVILIGSGLAFLERVSNKWNEQLPPIVFVPKTTDKRIEFWKIMYQGMQTAAREYGVEIQVVGTDVESDIDGQIRILYEQLAKKPKMMILAANDYERPVTVVRQLIDNGTKLVTVDSGLDSDMAASFVATDNYTAGVHAAETIRDVFPGNATIAVMNTVEGSATAMEREKGLRDALKPYSGIRLLETDYNGGLGDQSYAYTLSLLRSRDDIDGFVCLNESSTVGVARAVKDMTINDLNVIGFDSSMYELEFLEEGIVQALVVQKPFNMGYLAVEAAVKAYLGESVQSRIDTGSEVITKANMYTKAHQKLLFPFVK